MINFSSENFTGVHDKIMQALIQSNTGAVPSYGNDIYTEQAINIFKEYFGKDIEVFFTFNGTGANNFGLGSVMEKHQSVYCADVAHLYVNESTAPESFIGCRIYPVPSIHGKIDPVDLRNQVRKANSVHHPKPKVVSITQPTECGTVYTLEELQTIRQICTAYNMLLHVDGSRFFNAAIYLNVSLEKISRNAGVDILTLGGTKNGLMFGEAVIFFNMAGTSSFRYQLKRSMQMASKNRFIAAQFLTLLKDGLWKEIAGHTNLLAKAFAARITGIPGINIVHPVESNAVFAEMSVKMRSALQKKASFYIWDESNNSCRFIFSFDNSFEEIDLFADQLTNEILNN